MGTETKFNCYSENSSTDGCIPKVVKSSSDLAQKLSSNGIDNGKTTQVNGSTKLVVPFVPIFIEENNVIDGAKELLTAIRPQWNLNDVDFKKFTDGITNKLVGCFYNPPKNGTSTNGKCTINSSHHSTSTTNEYEHIHNDGNDSGNLSESDIESETRNTDSKSSNNVVLVRVYGNKTDLLIDRKAETQNIILLHSYGMAPSLYATFKNGLAYDYVPGVTLDTSSVLRPEIWKLVAHHLAAMHRVVKPQSDNCDKNNHMPMLWKKTQSFFDLVPEKFTDADKHKRLEGTFLPISRLRAEFAELYKHLESLGSPLVFAHNDLLLGNVVYTESRNTVNFIDYEYADYNFQAFDIGNHFAEFAGVDEVDYSRYPKREFQLEWLRVYLQAYLKKKHVTDDEVHRLYVQVNQFSLAAHFFWTIWCLIQAEHSKLDFDYVGYAYVRYNEYLARKDKFLALNINSTS
ncbi:ethanolamine kinase [Teleopsis dalmanni]|uniref:ethanolamine kinase n=1 Tax=Teleopsis dalmanni TaxID=139649 RepID=UPI0018CCC993|nr:ethanolamine kinase [Teleopsis dalmanni]